MSKMKVISVFNHKGGVSKTTTVFHLAWKLAKKGKRVLVVDGDPQCNLSGLILGENFDNYYSGPKAENNLMDGVRSAFEAKPMPIKAVECYRDKKNKNLFLLPGHMNLSDFEPSLGLALNSNNAIATLQNLPGSFLELIRLCSDKYDIDYVLIDMNPGLSSINQALFMSSDAFIVPINPDPFSLMALKTLNSILPRWKSWSENSQGAFKDAAYPLPDAKMKFVGIVVQRFNLRNKVPAQAFKTKIEEIDNYVEETLVPTLESRDMVYDLSKLIKEDAVPGYKIAEISDFGSLIQRSMKYKVPVYDLSDKQIETTGVVLQTMKRSKSRFNDQYEKMAKVIMEIVR